MKIEKQKAQKIVSEKENKFENYKKCLEATQPDNKRKYLEKNKIDLDSI